MCGLSILIENMETVIDKRNVNVSEIIHWAIDCFPLIFTLYCADSEALLQEKLEQHQVQDLL